MLTLRDSLHLVSDARNLDESVHEVFGTMLGASCCKEPDSEDCNGGVSESITAVVGFGGILTGACFFRCDAFAARQIAERMTGTEFPAVDDVVKDGIGEICNMLAGTWKSKVRDLAANCSLSVPTVITGSDYRLHVLAPEFRISACYAFEDVQFRIEIVCDRLQ